MGVAMKRILRSRLPERFADKVPPVVVEIAVSVLVVALVTLLRFALVPWIGDRAPYAFVFVAVAGATVLAGWRSGLLALVLGQLLAWNLIVDVSVPRGEVLHLVGGFIIATLAQLMVLAILFLYQREVDRAWSRREAQVDLIHHALAEIDHRTTNNYQTVLALISAQSRNASEPVRQALQQMTDRITAIAMAQKQMVIRSDDFDRVQVARHLDGLCQQIRQGLSRDGVSIQCRFEDIDLNADQSTYISIVVNELVTNALKHAFPDDRHGEIQVELSRVAGGLELIVADNGAGMKESRRARGSGIGTRLVDTFTKQLNARHEVETGSAGTRHRIQIPA